MSEIMNILIYVVSFFTGILALVSYALLQKNRIARRFAQIVNDITHQTPTRKIMNQANGEAKYRILDVVFSALMIIIVSPILVLISIAVYLIHGFPVLWSRDIIATKGSVQKVHLFRTCLQSKDPDEREKGRSLLRFLHISALDMLPFLFDILVGRISFFGICRMYKVHYDLLSPEEQDSYLSMLELKKPGMVSLYTVLIASGFDNIDRSSADIYFINHDSLRFRAMLLIATTIAVTISTKQKTRK